MLVRSFLEFLVVGGVGEDFLYGFREGLWTGVRQDPRLSVYDGFVEAVYIIDYCRCAVGGSFDNDEAKAFFD